MLKLIFLIICFNSVFAYFTLLGRCPDNVGLQENFRLADFYGKWYQAFSYSSDGQLQNNCSTIELITRPSGIYLNQTRIDRGLFHRFSVGKIDIPSNIEEASKLDLIFAFKNAPRRCTDEPDLEIPNVQEQMKSRPSQLGSTHQMSTGSAVVENGTEMTEGHVLESQLFQLIEEHQPKSGTMLTLKTRKYPFRVLATNYNYYATVYTCEYSQLINKHYIYVWILSRNPSLNAVSKELALKPLQKIGVDSKNLVQEDRSKCVPKYYEDVPMEPTTFRFPVPI